LTRVNPASHPAGSNRAREQAARTVGLETNNEPHMTASRDSVRTDREVEAAIARVLDAERGARAAVEAAGRDAEGIRAAARARDKRIAERAAARIAVVRSGVAQRRAARLAAIEADAIGPDPQAEGDERAGSRLDEAVARLADELIGGERPE
jgi:hypothetical protein